MSISFAPDSTEYSISWSLSDSGDNPAGKPVETAARLIEVSFRDSFAALSHRQIILLDLIKKLIIFL